ncbi:hypothetical protein ACIRVF_18895 [Kitasatospora sp. NPDC101157]|uniref:hypothetical protein n=1 Tax=Kitasatospora sp. NPDC101157 TaxID=3364098 RepID=UPI00382E59DD
MPRALEAARGDGGAAPVGETIGHMGELRGTAQQLSGIKLPADPCFSYGPEWLFVR